MEVIIAPIHQTFFVGRIWMGLDIEKIQQGLVLNGFKTTVIDFSMIANDFSLLPSNCLLFYSVSYNKEYHQYIKDVIYSISVSRSDVVIIPNLDQLFSFENKGFQELLKMRLGISKVRGSFYGDVEDYFTDKKRINFPIVFKTLGGAMSSGVSLIHNTEELFNIEKKYKKQTFMGRLRMFKKKWKKDKDKALQPIEKYSAVNFEKFFAMRMPFVAQEFIPELECDYKVLIFDTKYFVLKRRVRDNDFKASGSGKFTWVEPSLEILDFAKFVVDRMFVPFNSLDIIQDKSGCALVEFQGIGFGPLTLIGANYHYEFIDGKWQKITSVYNLEQEYSNSIIGFLNHQNENN